ncbi:hypothetical protein IMZ08_08165 [Bacillus luteolus]|uniref:Uncharacterized protein n=1 Tax=Litchfieldia luteola TaxID=682179 RepID=A0ABR9QHR3_9BACI|nr:hypothetical protein [Cytobacillus luteolus]MBE4908025.1 hypothetical protein [Cytobacillus luteolus]MBP1942808.1 hypothetical protein [Cytobacillus luteolus]
MDIMIQQLMGAIIENIIPLIFIIGIIVNIFKRFKEGGSGQNQPQQRKPVEHETTYEENNDRRTERNPFETMFEELDRKGREIFEQMDRKQEEPKPEVSNRLNEALSRINNQEASAPQRTEIKKVETIVPPKQKKSSSGALQGISRKRAVEGVIWAEILGPPRSKRPHSTYSRLNSRKQI